MTKAASLFAADYQVPTWVDEFLQKLFPPQQRSHRHTPIIIPRPREILLLPLNTVKYSFEQKAQPAGPHALHTEPRLALPHKWCNDTWAIHLSPLCLSRLITVHALGEQMTDDLQLKNKSSQLSIKCISFAQGRDASLTQPIFPPARNNSKQRMTTLLSLIKRPQFFLSSTVSSLKSPDVSWPTFKRIKDVSPALDYSVVWRPVVWSGARGSNPLRVQE